MFRLITGLYRAMEQGAVLALIAERHATDPDTMVDAIRAVFSPRDLVAEPMIFNTATEAEDLEMVAA